VQELSRTLPCSHQPKFRIYVSGVAFDHCTLPSVPSVDFFATSSGGSDIFKSESELQDIPCATTITQPSVLHQSDLLSSHQTRYSRVSIGAIVVLIVEALMLLLFDLQLMSASAVSPVFLYFWVAQVVVACISLVYFTLCICFRNWSYTIELFMAGVCLFTNIFVIICASMFIAQFNFTDSQIDAIRMTFLACRSFNCFACIVAVGKQFSKLIKLRSEEGRALHKDNAVSARAQAPSAITLNIATKQSQSSSLSSPFRRKLLQPSSSAFQLVTNRVVLLDSSHSRQDRIAWRQELMRICQPSNRLLLSVGTVWENESSETLDALSELSLGGHFVVHCSPEGHCGLVEFFGICTLVCRWLQVNSMNTVVIFHNGLRSCAAMLCCGILMGSGLSPGCEHALHLVMTSCMLNGDRHVGHLTTACSRRVLRHFECFLHADQHPISAFPRFLTLVAIKGCAPLPPAFSFSVDVICGGISRVKLGTWWKSVSGGCIARDVNCVLTSAGTYTFAFEANSIFCRGDVEIIISVKNIENGVSAKVCRVWSHSSFCGISAPHVARHNAAEVDWLGSKEAVPRLFTDIELHFADPPSDPAPSIFSGHLVHFNQPAFDSKVFLSTLLSRGTQIQINPGAIIKTDESINRNFSTIVILNGVCSVELSRHNGLKSATCILQEMTSGQMITSLRVFKQHACSTRNTHHLADVSRSRRFAFQICRPSCSRRCSNHPARVAALQ
jgi:hypothetical protein